jgi:ABC-type anion transport system duplicated permease subunit
VAARRTRSVIAAIAKAIGSAYGGCVATFNFYLRVIVMMARVRVLLIALVSIVGLTMMVGQESQAAPARHPVHHVVATFAHPMPYPVHQTTMCGGADM